MIVSALARVIFMVARPSRSAIGGPELGGLVADEVRLLLEHPVPAFLDDATLGASGDCLGRIEAVIAEGSHAAIGQHGNPEPAARQVPRLVSHLRDVAVVIEAG